jgi:hypothetical protein
MKSVKKNFKKAIKARKKTLEALFQNPSGGRTAIFWK